MATPARRAFRRIDSARIPVTSQGYKRIKAHLWDDNFDLLNTMLERLAQLSLSAGGVVVPGSVTEATSVVTVVGRWGVTKDGKTPVAVTGQNWNFAGQPDGYYLLYIAATERSLVRTFADPVDGNFTHTMLDDLGNLTVISDVAAYPATPADGVAVAQVRVVAGVVTAFAVKDEPPAYRSTAGVSSGNAYYDFLLGYVGKPAVSGLDWVLAGRAVTIHSTSPGSAYARTAPADASKTFDIKKNGVSVGSLSFAMSATTATFSIAADIVLAAGDRLELTAPATQDSALADVQVLLKGLAS